MDVHDKIDEGTGLGGELKNSSVGVSSLPSNKAGSDLHQEVRPLDSSAIPFSASRISLLVLEE